MKIKYKMPVFLLPLIIIPIIATSMIFIRNTSSDAIRLHNEIMHLNLETIAAKITEEYSILERVGVQESDYYLESTKTRIINYITSIKGADSLIQIYDFKGNRVYSSETSDLDFYPNIKEIIPLSEDGEKRPLQFTYKQTNEKYSGFHMVFVPWEWDIVIVSEERVVLSAISNAMEQSIIIISVVAIVIIGVFYVLSKNITIPLRTLTKASTLIGLGNFDERIHVNTNDEFQELAEAYNSMASRLSENFTKLESNKIELENQNILLSEEILEREKTQKELKASEEKFKIIFNNTFHLIGLLNTDGCLLEINETALNLTKSNYNDFVGKLFWESPLFAGSKEAMQNMKKAVERASRGVFVHELTEIEIENGITSYLDYSITPFLNEEKEVVLLIPEGRDISELINKRNELIRLNRELEDRVNERTAELQKTNQNLTVSLQETEKARLKLIDASDELEQSLENLKITQDKLVESKKIAALVSIVVGISHEINTPVGVCITSASYLELLLQELKERFESGALTSNDLKVGITKSSESVDLILKSLTRISNLITDFKMIAVDQENTKKKSFKLCSYINNTIINSNFELAESNHVVNFLCEEEIEIVSYQEAFSQIFNSLIDNSINHGFEFMEVGTINIIIKSLDEYVVIEYSDNGKGMEQYEVDKIFEPFYTTKLGKGRSGLGMNITYNLVTNIMGGTISVKSKKNEGITVTITLPQNLDSTLEV